MIEPEIKLNPSATIELRPIGDAGQCVVVDNFLEDPQALVEFAVQNGPNFTVPPDSYPGQVLPLSTSAAAPLQRYVRNSMSRHFPFLRGGVSLTSLISMTTLQPDELSNLQRLCHSDPRTAANRHNYAALLYLFQDDSLGGTAFYRWREPALIQEATALQQRDPAAALEFLKEHFAMFREAPAYLTDSNDAVERLATIPARFNRWVFYSGDIPHSAYITCPEKLKTDFAAGRLTLNCFASVVPQ